MMSYDTGHFAKPWTSENLQIIFVFLKKAKIFLIVTNTLESVQTFA